MTNLELFNIVLIAVASGVVGVFALMRRMILAADSVSHIALPGLGLAFLFNINPLIGAAATLFFGVLLIWLLENKTSLNTDVVIGVMFAVSLAIGSLLTPKEELIESLFGGASSIGSLEFLAGSLLALLVIAFILFFKNQLVISLVSNELAKATGINVARLNLYFLLIFALNIILGLKFLGVLLMGSLIIVPAAISRNLSININSSLVIAATAAVFSVAIGYLISNYYGIVFGPVVITVSAIIFLLSLLKKGQE